jgi:hypothetical protein
MRALNGLDGVLEIRGDADGVGAAGAGQQPADALVRPGTRIALARIDAGRAGIDALGGMQRILAENPSMPVILNIGRHLHSGHAGEDWLSAIRRHGFEAHEIDERRRVLRPLGLGQGRPDSLLLIRTRGGRVASLFEGVPL